MVKEEGIVKSIIFWDYMMNHQLDDPLPGQFDLDGNMADHPYWISGYIDKNKQFRI